MKDSLSKRIDEKQKKNEQNQNKQGYNLGLKISMDLVSSVIAGVLIGLGVDKVFSTKPIFFIIFLLLGIITGFYSLYKSFKKLG